MMRVFKFSSVIVKITVVVMLFSLLAIPVAANYDSCGVDVGSSRWCNNSMQIQDELANATHQMNDYFGAPDPYHIHFTMTSWYPSVTRGTPVYTTYWIMDNFNSQQIYFNDDYNGAKLNDYSNITIGTNVTAGYYPQPYGKPTTAMEIRNAPWYDCVPPNPKFLYCATYGQTSEFYVNQ